MIITVIVGFICFMLGACFGFVSMAIMATAGRYDQKREEEDKSERQSDI